MLDSDAELHRRKTDFGGQIGRDHADRIAQELADDVEHAERGHDRESRSSQAGSRRAAARRHCVSSSRQPSRRAAAVCDFHRRRQCIECPDLRHMTTEKERAHTSVRMTAIDFAAFVDELATVSGDAILPFFRTSLGVENKGARRYLRSGHRGRPFRRDRDAHADPGELSGPRHRRRGVRQRAHRRRICLGARPDRRHQVVHLAACRPGAR